MMQASLAPPFQEQSTPPLLIQGFSAGKRRGGTTQRRIASPSHRAQVSTNNSTLQHAIQGQDSPYVRQFSTALPHAQKQQNGSGLASRIGQNLNTPLPQGPGSLQQNFIQPSPSLPHANLQPSSIASVSQSLKPGAQQVPCPSSLSDMPLLQKMMESEKNLSAAGSSESDIQRQLRMKVGNNKRVRMSQGSIAQRTRAR